MSFIPTHVPLPCKCLSPSSIWFNFCLEWNLGVGASQHLQASSKTLGSLNDITEMLYVMLCLQKTVLLLYQK